MGKRRIRNLLKLKYDELIGFDSRKDRRDEITKKFGISVFSTINEAIKLKPELMIIATPPNLHLTYVDLAIKNKINFFVELNLLSKHVKKIVHKLSKTSVIGLPSCTMKFHPIVLELKKILGKNSIGKPLLIIHHSGQFLPYWHPWENYKDFFVSKRQTGGAKELVPIELTWLTDLFSEIKTVYGDIDKISSLDVDIDDVYQIIIEFKKKIFCNLIIDVFSIPPERETKIICEKGTIICNFNSNQIRIVKEKSTKLIQLKKFKVAKGYKGNTPSDVLYENEMKSFMDFIIKKKSYPYSFKEELKVLSILDAIEKSSNNCKKIMLKQAKK